jgi:septum formation protein
MVVPSRIDEKDAKTKSIREHVKKLARLKAEKVAVRFKDAIVIGADTLVIYKGKALGKPKDRKEAAAMLRKLSGKRHRVFTALCVIDTRSGRKFTRLVSTSVKFRKLSKEAIGGYINSGEPMDKAGAYAIQGRGAALVKSISGDFYNVVGLPVPTLLEILERLHVLPKTA